MIVLDKEEQELSESVDKGGWRSVLNLEEEIRNAKEYVRVTFAKNQRMNIRISKKDIDAPDFSSEQKGI